MTPQLETKVRAKEGRYWFKLHCTSKMMASREWDFLSCWTGKGSCRSCTTDTTSDWHNSLCSFSQCLIQKGLCPLETTLAAWWMQHKKLLTWIETEHERRRHSQMLMTMPDAGTSSAEHLVRLFTLMTFWTICGGCATATWTFLIWTSGGEGAIVLTTFGTGMAGRSICFFWICGRFFCRLTW